MSFAAGVAQQLSERDKNMLSSEELKLKKDDLKLRRRMSLTDALYKKLNTTRGSSKPSNIDALRKSQLRLKDKVNKAIEEDELDDTAVEYFKKISQDPEATNDLINFLDGQASGPNSRVIKLNELPTILKILEDKNINQEEKRDLFAELDLINFGNVKEIGDFHSKIMKMTKGSSGSNRSMFFDIDPRYQSDIKESFELTTAQLNTLTGSILDKANDYLINNPEASNIKSVETKAAIDNINSKETLVKEKARRVLFNYYLTPNFADEIIKNPLFETLVNKPSFNSLLRSSEKMREDFLVTENMAKKDSRLKNFIGQTISFYYGGNGNYYPIL